MSCGWNNVKEHKTAQPDNAPVESHQEEAHYSKTIHNAPGNNVPLQPIIIDERGHVPRSDGFLEQVKKDKRVDMYKSGFMVLFSTPEEK